MKKIKIKFKTKMNGKRWIFMEEVWNITQNISVNENILSKELKRIYGEKTQLLSFS